MLRDCEIREKGVLVTVGVPIIAALAGIVATVFASLYFFRRSLKHRFAIYSLSESQPFSDIDPEIRDELKMEFRKLEVKDLTVIYLLCANEGVNAIRGYIHPLTFSLPGDASMVDASVSYTYPEKRSIDVEQSASSFSAKFEILNPGDYFVIKALIQGKVSYRNLTCTITAENLPPDLPIESGARVAVGNEPRREYASLTTGLLLLIGGLATAWVLYLVFTLAPSVNPINVVCIILAAILALFSLGIGALGFLAEATDAFRPVKHFAIPIEIGGPYIQLPRSKGFSAFRKIMEAVSSDED